MATRRKVTIIVNEEPAGALESAGSMPSQLDEADWALVERRQQAERLAELLDQFDKQDGPLPDDPEEDARLRQLLGGAA
jgi:hypothetical protein